MEDHTYFSDKPLNSFEEDFFNRSPFAKRVAEVIETSLSAESTVIGINGKWGEGKTSVLNLIEGYFQEEEKSDILTIRFNPWLFSNEEEMLTNIFYLFADKLKIDLETKKEKTGNFIRNRIKPISKVLSNFPKVPDIGTQLTAFFVKANIDELRERIEKILLDTNKRIVIFVDDIDRLDKEEIYSIFKIVKLTTDFKNITYVLAFDNDLVASAIKDKYGNDNIQAGYDFLEKIVQIPLPLPKIDFSILRTHALKSIDSALSSATIELSESKAQRFVNEFRGLEPFLDTPRKIGLLSNLLHFSLPMLKDEVNTVDLLLIEAIKSFVPDVYKLVRNNKSLFLDNAENKMNNEEKKKELNRKKDAINEAIKFYSFEKRRGLIEVLKNLFPFITPAFENISIAGGPSSQWQKEQRICSNLYFDRYFLYSISPSDVADEKIKQFFTGLEKQSKDNIENSIDFLRTLIDDSNDKIVLEKIKDYIDRIDDDQRKKLCVILARTSDLMSDPVTFLGLDSPLRTSATITGQLIHGLQKKEEIREMTEKVFKESSVLSFAVNCFYSIGAISKRDHDDTESGDNLINDIGRNLSKHLLNEAYKLLSEDIEKINSSVRLSSLIVICGQYGQQKELNDLLKIILDKDEKYATKIIRSFLSKVHTANMVVEGEFEKDKYESIKKYIDINLIKNSIQKIYNEEELAYEDLIPGIDPTDKELASQFLWYVKQDDTN
ncbi:P-loop NTPase fold protein [uncultured Marinococcus sp.]|uniref:KAP family P-loop NTPase fold protein n=1 Tax=uncultured Marinococcus sp. TaxID=487012 RepID=UPI002624E5BE|nr:P-loop NTPase fold protein [uncultured Marinococcus sp.]